MDIIARLQNVMHAESAAIAPQTNEIIEAAREARAEIERLRAELALARAAIADAHVLISNDLVGPWAMKHGAALGAKSETPKVRKG